MDIVEILGKAGIVPVIVIEKEEQAVPLAKSLVKGGLPVLEVTFRTKAAAGAIAAIKRDVPEAVLGAGTLLTPEMVKAAKAAGAVFGVAPGFDPAVMAAAKAEGLPMCPGIATASELSQALTAGCAMVKFFPAEAAGGVKMIKNLLGAFRFTGVKFMPTWGVLKGFTVSAGIDNLFDRKYCDYAGYSAWQGRYYYPACGRSFMFTIRYDF